MSSERNILKRLLEGRVDYEESCEESCKDLDEKTYTVGDTQYWKRGGKCYKWTESGGRQECSEDEYFKAISGGNDKPVKPTEPSKDITKKSEPSPIEKRRNQFSDDTESDYVNYDGVKNFDHTTWDIDGYETTIQRNSSGRGYYLQNDDFDMEFDTKGDLVGYLKDNGASFAGYDSEKDY